jgi:hypothetical protein
VTLLLERPIEYRFPSRRRGAFCACKMDQRRLSGSFAETECSCHLIDYEMLTDGREGPEYAHGAVKKARIYVRQVQVKGLT